MAQNKGSTPLTLEGHGEFSDGNKVKWRLVVRDDTVGLQMFDKNYNQTWSGTLKRTGDEVSGPVSSIPDKYSATVAAKLFECPDVGDWIFSGGWSEHGTPYGFHVELMPEE